MRHSHFTERDNRAGSQHLTGSDFPYTPRQDRACFILSLPTQPSSSFLQALTHPNPRAHNQGLGLLPGPHLARLPSRAICPALSLNAGSLFSLLGPCPVSSCLCPASPRLLSLGDRVVMEGPGTQSAEDIFVTGFRDSQALGSQTHSWEREAGGRECRALSQGTLQFPSPCEE